MSVQMGTAQGRWVLAATIGGSSLALLDATVVNVALERLGRDLDAGFAQLQWVVNGYTLTLAALILLGGSLGDRLGRRKVFLIGIAWFAAASALCGLAPNVQTLIAARALQGVGGALLTPGSLALISATFAREHRAAAVGAWSGLGGVAAAIGPFVGGWLVEFSWRAVFLVNLPVAAAVAWIAVRHVPESRDDEAAGPLDLVGTVLAVVALGLLSYAFTTEHFSGTEATIAAAAVAAGAAFVIVEHRRRHPLVPLRLFADRTFSAANAATLAIYAALGVLFFLLALELQTVGGFSPVASGAALLPVTAVMLLLSSRMGALADRIGPRLPMTVGPLIAATGFMLYRTIDGEASYLVDVLPAALVIGLGLAVTVAPLTAAVLAAAPDHLAGTASGINNAVARTAGLLAVAAVPAVVGLGGGDYTNAPRFDRGFDAAMLVGAGLLVAGSAIAAIGVGSRRGEEDDVHLARCRACQVSGPQVHPGHAHEPVPTGGEKTA